MILNSQGLSAKEATTQTKFNNCTFETFGNIILAENCLKLSDRTWLVSPCGSQFKCRVKEEPKELRRQACPSIQGPRPKMNILVDYDYWPNQLAEMRRIEAAARLAIEKKEQIPEDKKNCPAHLPTPEHDPFLVEIITSRRKESSTGPYIYSHGSFTGDLDTNVARLLEDLKGTNCNQQYDPKSIGFTHIRVFSKDKNQYAYIRLSDLKIVKPEEIFPFCDE